MAELVAIVGDTGTGKSTAVQYLDPKQTYVINVANKRLPFKGSTAIYNEENKNYASLDVATDIAEKLERVAKNAPHIKYIVIDDSNYIMGFNMVRKATEVGYTKFSLMAQAMTNLILNAKKLRDDLIIFYLTHLEEVTDEDKIVGYKIKTAGKLLDSQIKLEGLFTICLYTNVEDTKDGMKYTFVTNRYKKFPAKSPAGMFDKIEIPNNLQYVAEKIEEYYK